MLTDLGRVLTADAWGHRPGTSSAPLTPCKQEPFRKFMDCLAGAAWEALEKLRACRWWT